MNNKELLELAAKAAGVPLKDLDDRFDCWEETPIRIHRAWNPLTDDGDALRLAVKLHLWEAVRLAHREVSDTVDIYAATRRAIVSAAAEIGKAMS